MQINFSITKIGQKSNYYSYIFSIFSVPELIRGALQLIAYFLSRKGADIKFLHKNETPFLKCFIIAHISIQYYKQKRFVIKLVYYLLNILKKQIFHILIETISYKGLLYISYWFEKPCNFLCAWFVARFIME